MFLSLDKNTDLIELQLLALCDMVPSQVLHRVRIGCGGNGRFGNNFDDSSKYRIRTVLIDCGISAVKILNR